MALFPKQYHSPGTAPGTLVPSSETPRAPLQLHLVDYSPTHVTIEQSTTVDQCVKCLAQDSVTWIHVQGGPTAALLQELGKAFCLHSLALEDILNSGQHPKVEVFNDQLFVILTLPHMNKESVSLHQISLFAGSNFLFSFYDGEFTEFDLILKRLRDGNTRLRREGADFLLYSIIDFVIDHGFPVLEEFGMQLESLEELILSTTR